MGALKRLILCLDGTWNADDSEQITNIVRIRDLINPKLETERGVEYQRVYYHNGVGTGLSTRDKIIGGADGTLARGMQWQGLSLRMTLHHEPTPWIPSTYMPTLAGRLFFLSELAQPLVAECN